MTLTLVSFIATHRNLVFGGEAQRLTRGGKSQRESFRLDGAKCAQYRYFFPKIRILVNKILLACKEHPQPITTGRHYVGNDEVSEDEDDDRHTSSHEYRSRRSTTNGDDPFIVCHTRTATLAFALLDRGFLVISASPGVNGFL